MISTWKGALAACDAISRLDISVGLDTGTGYMEALITLSEPEVRAIMAKC